MRYRARVGCEPAAPVDPRVTMTHMEVVSDGCDATPNPVQTRDALTLIGILAAIEGALLAGSVTDHWAAQLRDRFIAEGVLAPESTARDVRQAINEINHRLRYAVGEYPNPPRSMPVP